MKRKSVFIYVNPRFVGRKAQETRFFASQVGCLSENAASVGEQPY
jgi:hypothetical protein